MALEYKTRNPNVTGAPTTLDYNRVRTYTLEVTSNAEEGSVATSSIVVDDPTGNFDIVGHRDFAIRESAVLSGQSYIFVGATAERKIRRGPTRVEAGREWEVTLVDLNTFLERRVMVGTDNNRPAETDVARVQWLLTTAEGAFIHDTRYFSTANPVAMDAVDYRGQTFKSVLDDCAQQSGKNYFVTTFEDTGTTVFPWGLASLWYDFASSTSYASSIALSNDLSAVNSPSGGLTFPIANEATELTRDPSRVYSSTYVEYDGGTAYVNNITTANNFARRDAIVPAQNVKTAAKAVARGTRYLADIATEEDIIKTAFQVPAASVNLLREGMRVPFQATHLPGYETPQFMRVLNRTVKQDSEATYWISCELGTSGTAAGFTGSVVYVVAASYGSFAAAGSIAASDDGVSWTTVVADISAGATYTLGNFKVWTVPVPDQGHRYWSVYYNHVHPGGFYAGFDLKVIRLLDANGVDALGLAGDAPPVGSPPVNWPPILPVVFTGPSVPYVATSNGSSAQMYGTSLTTPFSNVYPGPVTGDFTIASAFGDARFGLGTGVPPAGAITARWVWDLGA